MLQGASPITTAEQLELILFRQRFLKDSALRSPQIHILILDTLSPIGTMDLPITTLETLIRLADPMSLSLRSGL